MPHAGSPGHWRRSTTTRRIGAPDPESNRGRALLVHQRATSDVPAIRSSISTEDRGWTRELLDVLMDTTGAHIAEPVSHSHNLRNARIAHFGTYWAARVIPGDPPPNRAVQHQPHSPPSRIWAGKVRPSLRRFVHDVAMSGLEEVKTVASTPPMVRSTEPVTVRPAAARSSLR